MRNYRTSPPNDKRGGSRRNRGDKAPPRIHHAQVIRAALAPPRDPVTEFGESALATPRQPARAKRVVAKPLDQRYFLPAPVPSWARANGRAAEDPLFAAGAGGALLDAFLRREPPAAGALRARLALPSAAASTKILRLNTHEGALRDLRFAVGDAGPAARLLQLWRDLAGRPPSLDPSRLTAAAALLDLAPPDPNGLASSLKDFAGRAIRSLQRARVPLWCFLHFRTPRRPKPRSSLFGCSTSPSPSGCAGPGPCRWSPPKSSIRPCDRQAGAGG